MKEKAIATISLATILGASFAVIGFGTLYKREIEGFSDECIATALANDEFKEKLSTYLNTNEQSEKAVEVLNFEVARMYSSLTKKGILKNFEKFCEFLNKYADTSDAAEREILVTSEYVKLKQRYGRTQVDALVWNI